MCARKTRSKHKGQMNLTEILYIVDVLSAKGIRGLQDSRNFVSTSVLIDSITSLCTALVRSLEQLRLWGCGQKVASQTGWVCGWVRGSGGDSSPGPEQPQALKCAI